MAADPPRNRVAADFMWTQEPYRVRSKARVPVYLVPDPPAAERLQTLRQERRHPLLGLRDDTKRLAQLAPQHRRQGGSESTMLSTASPASICVAWCWRRTRATISKASREPLGDLGRQRAGLGGGLEPIHRRRDRDPVRDRVEASKVDDRDDAAPLDVELARHRRPRRIR